MRKIGSGWFPVGVGQPLPSETNDVASSDGLETVRLHVVTKNLQSIRDTDRFQDFFAELDDVSFDLLCVTETWREEVEDTFKQLMDTQCF